MVDWSKRERERETVYTAEAELLHSQKLDALRVYILHENSNSGIG